MTRWLTISVVLATCGWACTPSTSLKDDRWVELFDGKTLQGWTVVQGDLPFEVRDGEIVGATAVDVPTRYLTTTDRYGDFILELEMNNESGQNSGVQFRSVADAPFYTGLTGYQLEVDPSARRWTGGVYFEGVGIWLHPPVFNPACVDAWREDGWNRLRIEARGEQMRTFVNGVSCAYLFDEYLREGHVGLQIHSIGSDPENAGAETRWRNIRILENPEATDYSDDEFAGDSMSFLVDRLSEVEENSGWVLARLINGVSGEWQKDELRNPINSSLWQADVLHVSQNTVPAQATIPVAGNSYHLIADVKIDPGTTGELIYPVSSEDESGRSGVCHSSFRIFDDRSLNAEKADATKLVGSLTGRIAAMNLSEPDRDKRVLDPAAWQRIEIKVEEGKIEHWLNAVKIVEYDDCIDRISPDEPGISIRIDEGRARFRTIKLKN